MRPLQDDVEVDAGFGLKATPFFVPGKVPLHEESGSVSIGAVGETTLGLEIRSAGARLVYIPGCAKISEEVLRRVAGADLLLFDGTTFTDDEMVRLGLSQKTAWRMGHMAISGEEGSLRAFAGVRRRAQGLYPYQQHEPHPHRRLARAARGRGGGLGSGLRRNGDRAVNDVMAPHLLEAELRQIGAERYHNLHPFHRRLHGGECSLAEVRPGRSTAIIISR